MTDDNKYRITPKSNELKTDVHGGDISENLDRSVKKSDISMFEDIANSETVEIKFTGKQYYDTRKITRSEKKAIKNILKLYQLFEGY